MNPSVRSPSLATSACPRCGSSSTSPFAAGGVCLRCAGARVLERESGAPFSAGETSLGGTAEDRAGLPDRIGDYEIIDITGDIELTSDRADVRLSRVGGNARLNIGRSDLVRAMDVKGKIDLQGRGSDVELENIAGQVTINGGYSGNLEFKTQVSSMYIYGQIESGELSDASATATVLLLVSLIVLGLVELLQRAASRRV